MFVCSDIIVQNSSCSGKTIKHNIKQMNALKCRALVVFGRHGKKDNFHTCIVGVNSW